MLLIPVQLAPSPVHGLGIFTVHPVPAGTPIWRFEPGFDQELGPAEFAALSEPARDFLRHYAYLDVASHRWVLNGDHGRFMNHSDHPNTGASGAAGDVSEGFQTVALVDLPAGAELTCDYRAFDGDADWKLCGGPVTQASTA